MGKPTGFIEWQRVLPKKKSVAERLGDFKEFYQQSDAAGFIRLYGLPQRVRALKDRELAKGNGAVEPAEADALALA